MELTYFWGLAGTLQAAITPDLYSHFPHLGFLAYVVEHLGILVAAVYLVVGLGITPRRGAARKVFAITAAFTAAVGSVERREPDRTICSSAPARRPGAC